MREYIYLYGFNSESVGTEKIQILAVGWSSHVYRYRIYVTLCSTYTKASISRKLGSARYGLSNAHVSNNTVGIYFYTLLYRSIPSGEWSLTVRILNTG